MTSVFDRYIPASYIFLINQLRWKKISFLFYSLFDFLCHVPSQYYPFWIWVQIAPVEAEGLISFQNAKPKK